MARVTASGADSDPLDLVIVGGRVLDPSTGLDGRLDVGVRHGRIAALAPDLGSRIVPPRTEMPVDLGTAIIDATGLTVSPGFIDLHTHVFVGGSALTVPADESSSISGVTTAVSAGDAGAHTIEAFRRLAVEGSRTRVLAFLHASTVGLTPWPVGEVTDLELLDVPAGARAAIENADIVVGVKVRMSRQIVGDFGLEPLRRAVAIADRAGLPVMVHIGDAPAPLVELLGWLRPGDIVTHCYTGSANGLLDDEGRLAPGVEAARARGVRFDVGHGYGSFAYRVAEPATAAGFWPDTISTDLHSLSANGPVFDLPTTMAKFLALGLPLADVVRAVTSAPAEAIGRSSILGSIAVGRPADLAVFEVEDGPTTFRDSVGDTRRAGASVRVRHTIRAGIPWFGPMPHPGRGVGLRFD